MNLKELLDRALKYDTSKLYFPELNTLNHIVDHYVNSKGIYVAEIKTFWRQIYATKKQAEELNEIVVTVIVNFLREIPIEINNYLDVNKVLHLIPIKSKELNFGDRKEFEFEHKKINYSIAAIWAESEERWVITVMAKYVLLKQ